MRVDGDKRQRSPQRCLLYKGLWTRNLLAAPFHAFHFDNAAEVAILAILADVPAAIAAIGAAGQARAGQFGRLRFARRGQRILDAHVVAIPAGDEGVHAFRGTRASDAQAAGMVR
jgi:hypothetical protein